MNYGSYDPTSLFAGEKQPVHRAIMVAANQNAAGTILPRGTVLGRPATGAAVSSVKASGANTGNGTLVLDGAAPVQANAQPGLYTVRFTAAGTFRVLNPTGYVLGDVAVGAGFTDMVKFTTTAGGTAFVAGDGFDITVAAGDTYVISKSTATDGSQIPSAVTAYDMDTSAGASMAPCYFEGEFAIEKMTYDASWSTFAALQAAFRQNNIPIFARSVGALG